MSERTRLVGHAALSGRMGWASPEVARSMTSVAKRRRNDGKPRPGDVPEPDGYDKQGSHKIPWWYEDTIAVWDAGRPRTIAESRNVPGGLKTCSRCGKAKAATEYSGYADVRAGRAGKWRLHAKCKTCRTELARDWSVKNPERHNAAASKSNKKHARRRRATTYGLTEIELMAMEAAQQGICLICGEFAAAGLVVDHDHATDVVRGLLCGLCNVGLGAFRDDPKRLLRAILYLKTRGNGVFAEPDRARPRRVA